MTDEEKNVLECVRYLNDYCLNTGCEKCVLNVSNRGDEFCVICEMPVKSELLKEIGVNNG